MKLHEYVCSDCGTSVWVKWSAKDRWAKYLKLREGKKYFCFGEKSTALTPYNFMPHCAEGCEVRIGIRETGRTTEVTEDDHTKQ